MAKTVHKKGLKIALSAAIIVLVAIYIFALPRKLFDSPLSAVLESSDGRLMGARIAADGQWRFPEIDSVPKKFAISVITFEDKRFRHHPGIDFLAVGRAVRLNLTHGRVRSGASTLTMQTIRLSRGDRPRVWSEKIIEAILATRLELRCTKDEILALYASNAPFGSNVIGLPAASWRYFGRSPEDLSWAESAMLAVLPNAPALIHPGRNRDRLLEKRNLLLGKLLKAGYIDSEEYELACDEPLPDKPYPMPDIAYHYLETLRQEGGDRLYQSRLDYGLQLRAEEVVKRHGERFATNGVYNMAAIVLDVHTGEPIIYIGNLRNTNGSVEARRAASVDVAKAPRSSGSTLKPLLYAAMLDEGSILPGMLIADTPFHFKDFAPHNFNHSFDGAVTASSVIQRSLNVPSVRMLQQFGIERFISVLQDAGFTTITRGGDIYGLSLILGGAEITLRDLAGAYRQMALCLDAFPKPKEDQTKEERAVVKRFPISAGAAWCTFETLTGVTRPEEEGEWQSFHSARRVAWKTGTSFGNRDAWSVGVTPDYVVAVWTGNCDGEGRPLMTGVGYAAPVMFDLFNLLPPTRWFVMPENDLHPVATCPLSGHPISAICLEGHPDMEPDTVLVPFAPASPVVCPYHRIVHLNPEGTLQVNSDCCPIDAIRNESWFVLPPAQEWYYMRSHSSYKRLPPLHPALQGAAGSGLIEIIYPQAGMTVASPLDLDSQSRGVIFSAAHSDPTAVIYWNMDDIYLGMTSNGEHKIKVVPSPGPHRLVLVDANGNTASVRFNGR